MVSFEEAREIALKKRAEDDKKYSFLDSLSPEQKELLRGEYLKVAFMVALMECIFAVAFIQAISYYTGVKIW